ncbi:MAG: NADH-quinone oxidoreductase subunit A [Acidimicrobiales bacterium]
MDQYLPVVVMLLLAVLFAGGSFFASRMLGPRRPTSAKMAPYECGIVPDRVPAERFPVRFYLVAMIFIIFDIEIIFLFPWAVLYRELGVFGLVEMGIFAAAVFVSFIYLIGNGALNWGPVTRVRTAGVARTSDSTIRRVGITERGLIDPAEPGTSGTGSTSLGRRAKVSA